MNARELRSIAMVGDRCFDMVTHEDLDPYTLEPLSPRCTCMKGRRCLACIDTDGLTKSQPATKGAPSV